MSEEQQLKTIKQWRDEGFSPKFGDHHRGINEVRNFLFGHDQVSKLVSEGQQEIIWMIKGQVDDLQKILSQKFPSQDTMERIRDLTDKISEAAKKGVQHEQ